jgi:16S rRNA G1207 methylase RsmC
LNEQIRKRGIGKPVVRHLQGHFGSSREDLGCGLGTLGQISEAKTADQRRDLAGVNHGNPRCGIFLF